jgi:hypothetical protein
MLQVTEWQNFQKAYSSVQVNERVSQTDEILGWLIDNKKITQYINTQTVLARQAKTHESINKGAVKVNKGDWIVLSEQKTSKLIGPEFEFLYEYETPVSGSGIVKIYQLRKRRFWGAIYEGKSIEMLDSKNKHALLEAGDLIGAYEPMITKNNFLIIKNNIHSRHFSRLEAT